METTTLPNNALRAVSPHPLVLVAAASVTVLSLAGVGVLAGWLPGPNNHSADATKTVAAAPATAPISIQQSVTVPQEKPKVAAVEARHTSAHRGSAATTVAVSSREPVLTNSSRETTPVAETRPTVPVQANGYGGYTSEPVYRTASPAPSICASCGIVQAVNEVTVEPKASGGGAVAGGVVGGLIANQIGKGVTRDLATVLGAVGGAYAGNHIEKSMKEAKRYDVVVRFEDGSTRTFSGDTPPTWHAGDSVQLQNGTLINGGGRSSSERGTI